MNLFRSVRKHEMKGGNLALGTSASREVTSPPRQSTISAAFALSGHDQPLPASDPQRGH